MQNVPQWLWSLRDVFHYFFYYFVASRLHTVRRRKHGQASGRICSIRHLDASFSIPDASVNCHSPTGSAGPREPGTSSVSEVQANGHDEAAMIAWHGVLRSPGWSRKAALVFELHRQQCSTRTEVSTYPNSSFDIEVGGAAAEKRT